MGKFGFIVGAGIGFVLGARAGREQYERIKRIAKAAVASRPVQGAIQMVTAAVAMTLVGIFADHTPAPMLIGIALCALAAMLTTLWTLRRLPAHLVSSVPPSS